jgi:hypothetical protein
MSAPTRIQNVTDWMAKLFPKHGQIILRVAARLTTWFAYIAVVSGGVSYVLNGKDFFTEKLPRAIAYVAKFVLLGGTFRPVLVRHVIEKDLGYAHMCVDQLNALDLDNDGEASDLILSLYPQARNGTCEDPMSLSTIYVVLKLNTWQGIWPRYQSVSTLARSSEGGWGVETSLPMTFASYGSFLVARTSGTDFPGYMVFGYANGVLHSYGRFRPMGSSFEVEDEDAEPVLQIGNQMFLNTEDGIYRFQVSNQDTFVPAKPLTSLEIVERNNAALILERFEQMPINPRLTDNGTPVQTYVRSKTRSDCGSFLFANGDQVPLLTSRLADTTRCAGELQVSRTTVITPRIPCAAEGLRRTTQFPWGYVYDPSSTRHVLACPLDGDHDSFEFEIDVTLREESVPS